MTRFYSLLLLLSFSLYALDSSGVERADHWMQTKTKKTVLKAYHEYKNIRINAIMQDNRLLRIQALQGIVKSGQFLRINIAKYRNELLKLDAQVPAPLKDSHKLKSFGTFNELKNARWKEKSIVLGFASYIQENQINYFILDKKFSKNYRYIFDIKAKANPNIKLNSGQLEDLRLNASTKRSVRLVLESKTPLPLKYYRRGKELIIKLNKGKKLPTENISIPIRSRYQSKKIVVIDPGHGGKDGGAVGYRGYREKIIVFDISKYLKKELEKLNYKVYMTRTSDKFIKLRKRTAYANKRKADLFISVHANSVVKKGRYKRHHGVETYYLSTTSSKRAKNVAATENSRDVETMNYFSKESFLGLLNSQKIVASNKLAIDLQRGMLGMLRKSYRNIKDAGVKKGPFWVLVGAQMPAVLVEVGFVSSPQEAKNLVSRKYQKKIAQGLAVGVKSYFNHNR